MHIHTVNDVSCRAKKLSWVLDIVMGAKKHSKIKFVFDTNANNKVPLPLLHVDTTTTTGSGTLKNDDGGKDAKTSDVQKNKTGDDHFHSETLDAIIARLTSGRLGVTVTTSACNEEGVEGGDDCTNRKIELKSRSTLFVTEEEIIQSLLSGVQEIVAALQL